MGGAGVGVLPQAVLVVGPTAVGKTEAALALAADLGGEIVSLDSRQVYSGLDIGTAKPTAAERAVVPHHLMDIAAPDERPSLADIQARAYAATDEILRRGRLPLLVGGTGQYVRAIAEGWRVPRVAPDPVFRAAQHRLAEAEGPAALHARLAAVDPTSAAAIDPRNVRRVIRALEVHAATGRPFSELRAKSAPPFSFVWVGLTRPREALYARIDHRIEAMLQAGLEDEVRRLVAAGYGFDLPAMSSLGYAEWRDFLAGEIDRAEVVRRIRRSTRRLVRSQDTWFRRDDARIRWFDLEAAAYAEIRDFVARAVRA